MKFGTVSRSSSDPIPARMHSKWAKENADIILPLWNFSYVEEQQIATSKAVGNAEICLWNRHNEEREVQDLHFFFLSHIWISLTLPFLPIALLMSRKAGGSYTQPKFTKSGDSKGLNPNGAPNRQIKFCHCTRVNICQAEHKNTVGICTAEAFNGLSQDYPYNCQVFENKYHYEQMTCYSFYSSHLHPLLYLNDEERRFWYLYDMLYWLQENDCTLPF